MQRVINRAERLLHFVDTSEGQNFLEVGCGNGAVSKHMAQKYSLNVTGVDIDPEQVQLATKNANDTPNVRFLAADATSLPCQDNDFDIVLSSGVMHHIANWLDALGEIRRVLRPKGYFIYYDLIYKQLTARLGRLFQHSYGITTRQDLDSFIKKNGFSTIHTSMANSLIWYELEAVYQSN